MFQINDNYQKLPGSYLFSTIAKKVAAFSEAHFLTYFYCYMLTCCFDCFDLYNFIYELLARSKYCFNKARECHL